MLWRRKRTRMDWIAVPAVRNRLPSRWLYLTLRTALVVAAMIWAGGGKEFVQMWQQVHEALQATESRIQTEVAINEKERKEKK